jgi:hypothetical protein
MDRIHHPSGAASAPSVDAHGTPGFPGNSTIFTPWMAHQLIEELRNIVLAAGLTPDKSSVTQVRDALALLYGGRGALLALTSPLTIGNAVETAVTWPAPIYDDAGLWASGTPTRITIPAGVSRIRVACQTTWENQASGDRKMRVVRNGSIEGNGLPAMRLPSAGASDVTVLNAGGGIIAVTPGDYLQLLVFQDRGANLDLRLANTWLHIEVLR